MNGLARPNGLKPSATLLTMSLLVGISSPTGAAMTQEKPSSCTFHKTQGSWLMPSRCGLRWISNALSSMGITVSTLGELLNHLRVFIPAFFPVLIWTQAVIHVRRFSHGLGCKLKCFFVNPGFLVRHELGKKWSKCHYDMFKLIDIRIMIRFKLLQRNLNFGRSSGGMRIDK